MKRKLRVGVLFGGKSGEHEVSLQSAKNVIEAMDKKKYEVIPVGIDKRGRWHLSDLSRFLFNAEDPAHICLGKSKGEIVLRPGEGQKRFDIVFPVLHGSYGEDGTIQGFLKLVGVPFVGAGVLGSAVGMDKDVMKRLLREAGIPTPKFLVFRDPAEAKFESVRKKLGVPVFVKPANLGSSIGVSKARNEREFRLAIKEAFKYDGKVLVEEAISGREIECSVLGNDKPIASVPGEIIPHPKHGFYSYEAKYLDQNGALLRVPAKLSKALVQKAKTLAVKTFRVLNCEGMGRVDMFLTKDGKFLVNEINTIPGFTKISMYPKLWEASGISYTELIDRLIRLALERHARESKLKIYYLT